MPRLFARLPVSLHGPALKALIALAVLCSFTALILLTVFFNRTESTGHLWWKETKEIPFSERRPYLVACVGSALAAVTFLIGALELVVTRASQRRADQRRRDEAMTALWRQEQEVAEAHQRHQMEQAEAQRRWELSPAGQAARQAEAAEAQWRREVEYAEAQRRHQLEIAQRAEREAGEARLRWEQSTAGQAALAYGRGDRYFSIELLVDGDLAHHLNDIAKAGWLEESVGGRRHKKTAIQRPLDDGSHEVMRETFEYRTYLFRRNV
ncbi:MULTISPECIES: hypothetical protein [unclassified Nocardioides]|uniref:hypothetical protein n=1 Tax=unclassified Nocardioides TaxID=2615069 RepID=UPI00070144A3|nr:MULTISPECIES: hypothetical protein [unclassified Nocardioides]KRA37931.1 hypothetical protein ASD81_04395 [Nocardioides sp. Root614]KRA91891.1 hypothetical protein ASD84_04660 [Nocardioides sp. Root682]